MSGAKAKADDGDDVLLAWLDRHHEDPSSLLLQKFHTPDVSNDQIQTVINEQAREKLLSKKSLDLLDHEELKQFYAVLEKHATPPFSKQEDDKFISWTDYQKVIAQFPPKFERVMSPKAFMSLIEDDPYCRVSVNTVFNYVMRKTWLRQTRIGLSIYDETGRGFIIESGLDCYIRELLPTLVQLKDMDEVFLPFYICTAIRKFFFFLDPSRTGRIRILDILCSGFIDDILDLREDEPPKECNWFSSESALRAYSRYVVLDSDQNGLLTKADLQKFNHPQTLLTPAFISRIFQEYLTFSGEMDYKCYLDFVLAFENRKEPQALQYYFRVLDIKEQDYLDSDSLNYFLKEIEATLKVHSAIGDINFGDVQDEIFDMVKPKIPGRITLNDLIESGQGHIVIQLLSDVNGFLAYEQRESIVQEVREEGSVPMDAN